MLTDRSVLTIRGGQPLVGDITVRGAKNALSKEMVAALLTDQPCTLGNVAQVRDVEVVGEMIAAMGGQVGMDKDHALTIASSNLSPLSAQELDQFAGKSRIPILLCGPLLHRFGEVSIPSLGGCNIGSRPIDFHFSALQQMGATISEDQDYVHLKADRLVGAKIHLPYPSVGATEQILLAAVTAQGLTEISNAAVEPEILDLIMVLQKMGAIISVDTDRVIAVVGVEKLGGYQHTALPDRLEVASWACVAAATGGKIFVRNARQQELLTFLNKFRQIGGGFEITGDGISFWRQQDHLLPISLETDVYPGFSTDYQQPFVVTLTQAWGMSVVHETVYEERFGYTEALNHMGAHIQLNRECLGGKPCRFGARNYLHSAVIEGPTPLHAARVRVPDLRGGFSYVIAALVAKGESTLENIQLLERGYEQFSQRLEGIGADISLSDN
jgi:UDP-N-acetylglucosamine 1-carboxyvinyltransferase